MCSSWVSRDTLAYRVESIFARQDTQNNVFRKATAAPRFRIRE